MSDLTIGGVSVWRSTSEDGIEGIEIGNQQDDASAAVSVTVHGGEVVGVLVRINDPGEIVARWGLVGADEAT